ncbi:vacuolar cation-transporting ATPase Ypk9p [Diutina catenulata]
MTRPHRPSTSSRRPSAQWSRSRRGSLSSVDSSSSRVPDENFTEMWSGAASEVIPSSISSLHYPHEFGRFRSRHDSAVSHESASLLPGRSSFSSARSSTEGDDSNFRFFSYDQIEQAPGGSTLEDAENPVDFNTDWDYTVDKYDDEEEAVSARAPATESSSGYGSLEEAERRGRRRSSDASSSKMSFDDEPREVDDDVFRKEYPSKSTYQRYYLAEEDLVLGIAGYTTSMAKSVLYYVLCVCTLGMAYVVLRWFPRYRINLLGNPAPLGVATWCVVENEFGELAIVPVSSLRYGDRLSSFISDNEALNDTAPEVELDELPSKRDADPIVPYIHCFSYRYLKFFYSPSEDIFRTNSNWYDGKWLAVKSCGDGVSQSLHDQRLEVFGANSIELENKSVGALLVEEVLHPFYVFQVFSVFLWLADDYYYYASCIFLISAISIANSLVETKGTIRRLQEMSKFTCEVRVWRNEFWKQVDSQDLVPGDVFEVDPSLSLVPCDALLINGECVVNESMLTGESVPVTKAAATQDTVEVLPENFKTPLLSRSFLFNGTRLLKMKSDNDEPVKAMCVATGFNTTKGSLVRSMLFPKPMGFKFYEDSFKYIGFMTLIAAIGFTYSTYNFIKLGLSHKLMLLRALDIITIVVPPALPATLTIGTTFAVARLRQLEIFCISPTRVNVGGKLDVVAFDKTGTLTEDGLDVLGVHVANSAPGRREMVFSELHTSGATIEEASADKRAVHNGGYVLAAMTSCHQLRDIDGELLGDPLDVKMFEQTGWQLREDDAGKTVVYSGSHSFTILKEYEFVSSLRRMSVLVSGDGHPRLSLVKGAPEVMTDLCDPSSLPSNFDELLHHYTHAGFRVIALAYRELGPGDAASVDRAQAESSLTFAGFIIFENKLKPSTKPTLAELNHSAIRTVMCTGDNVLTAISVARESGLVDSGAAIYMPSWEEDELGNHHLGWVSVDNSNHYLDPVTLAPVAESATVMQTSQVKLAVTGDVFRYLLTELKSTHITQAVLMNCDIFARMSPDEKHELVEQLQGLDYTVGFCGDGANDCGALKAADVGISLSEAEASVAAPFTSRKFEISCVIDVIKEGRSSLVTSFSCFKYMSLYSAIQFISVSILYKGGTNLGDFQFLYIDLFLILPLAIFMSWTKPYHKLVTKRPTANLVSPKVLVPLICHILVILLFQVVLWLRVRTEPWYKKPVPGGDDEVKSSDNTVLFLFTNFQYILVSVVLSVGPPYREPMSKNMPYMVNLFVSTAISIGLFAIDGKSKWGDFMQLTNLSHGFYWLILVAAALNLGVLLMGESQWFVKVAHLYKRLFRRHTIGKSKKLFKNLTKEQYSRSAV